MSAEAKKNSAFGVVILGAGASSRMGKPKLLLRWRGTTIIGHLISQWQMLGAAQIAIVCRPNDRALTAELKRLHFPEQNRIENPEPERGMFSSIVCAANWSGWNREISSWAIALGDQPHLKTETLRALLEFHSQNAESICQPMFSDCAAHPVILPQSAFEELKRSCAGTLKDFLKLISCRRVQCVIDDAGLALDLDTPDDYQRISATAK